MGDCSRAGWSAQWIRSLRLCVRGGLPQERVGTGRASRTLPPAACPGFPAAPSPCACRPGPPAASLPANQRQQLCDTQGGRPHCVLCSPTLAPQAREGSFSLTVARRARLPYPIPGSAAAQDACPPALSSGPTATRHEHQAKHAVCPAGVAPVLSAHLFHLLPGLTSRTVSPEAMQVLTQEQTLSE